ncbi:MAG: TonB family protein [Paludibacteraceae bacterium]|nr:TonB family protein [Paludibacteraceae bacterium]
MKQFALYILFLSLSLTNAFAVKFSIEKIDYHANCKGPVKSVKEINENSVYISYYAEDGRFLRGDQINNGKTKTVSSIKYNKYGNPVEYISYGDTTLLKYNSQQQLVFIEEHSGNYVSLSEKQYNPKGLECRAIGFRRSGEYDVMGDFFYDDNNNVTEIRSYRCRRKGWEKTGLIQKEYTENNVLKTEYWYDYGWNNTAQTIRCKKIFNSAGKLETELEYGIDGVAYGKTTYIYDEQGNMTKRYRTDSKLLRDVQTKTYTYDKYGNPTEIKIVKEVNGKVDYSNTTRYEYEYYPTVKKAIEPAKAKVTAYGPTAKLESEGKWTQSFKTLTDLAAKGNKEAQCRLAYYYATATATPADFQKAAELYKAAADKGSAEAQYYLGYCYFMGTGVERSIDEAGKWFAMAAEKGYKKAYYDAALLIQAQSGDDVSEKGMRYFKKSAATGYQPAKRIIQTFEEYQNEQEEKRKAAEKAKKLAKSKKNEVAIAAADEVVTAVERVMEYVENDDFVYTKVEEKASYKGGLKAMKEYLEQNLVYPEQAKKEGKQGTVFLIITVNKDGSITDIEIVRPVDPAIDIEAVRLVKGMPNWVPGKIQGKPVRSKYTLPIKFTIPETIAQ